MNRDNAAIALDDAPTGDEFSAEERAYFESGGQSSPAPPKIEDNRLSPEPEADADADADAEEIEVEDVEDDGETPDEPLRDEKGRFVPKSAYLRVKEQAKSTNDKLAQVAAELIRMRERQAVLNEMATRQAPEQAPEADAEIDPNEDIFGAYAQMAKKLKEMEQRLGQTDTQTRAQIEAMAMQAKATQDLQQFAAKTPEFMDAYKHLVTQRHKELEALGLTDEAQRNQAIEAEARELVSGALKAGRSAAEQLWKLALARGYQFKPKGEAAELNKEAAEEIERINKGKKASVSLKGGGGASSSLENITVTKLAEMSEDDFSRTMRQYKAKYGESGWRKLMGG